MGDPLQEKRRALDTIDNRLASLLADRFSVVRSLAGLKKKILDPRREAAVLKHAVDRVKNKGLRSAILAVYREILKQSRLLQKPV
jgi:chorismate mutase